MKSNNLILTLLVISNIISIYAISLNLGLYSHTETNLLNTEINDTNCTQLDVFTTSECLNKELKTWYKYNLSNVGKNISLETLKIEGGVCRHFTDWYKQSFLNLGAVELKGNEINKIRSNDSVYLTEVIIPAGDQVNHVFLMVSSKYGECKLDNELINCWEFKNV